MLYIITGKGQCEGSRAFIESNSSENAIKSLLRNSPFYDVASIEECTVLDESSDKKVIQIIPYDVKILPEVEIPIHEMPLAASCEPCWINGKLEIAGHEYEMAHKGERGSARIGICLGHMEMFNRFKGKVSDNQ